jgi:hypothetical protein
MALEAVFQELRGQCQKGRDIFNGLHLAIVEDRPLTGDLVLIDKFGDAVEDSLGGLEEMYAAVESSTAGHQAPDLERARRALVKCQERFNRVLQQFCSDLAAHDRLAALLNAGRERRGEWRAWTQHVKETIEQCQHVLFEINHALCQCWQEIAERVGLPSVSVQTTNIGQKITAPESVKAQGRNLT